MLSQVAWDGRRLIFSISGGWEQRNSTRHYSSPFTHPWLANFLWAYSAHLLLFPWGSIREQEEEAGILAGILFNSSLINAPRQGRNILLHTALCAELNFESSTALISGVTLRNVCTHMMQKVEKVDRIIVWSWNWENSGSGQIKWREMAPKVHLNYN